MTAYPHNRRPTLRAVSGLIAFLFASGFLAQSSDEVAIRKLAEGYFAAYAAKNLDAIRQMWSDSSPDLVAHSKALEKLFADNDRIDISALSVERVKTDGDAAQVRVTLVITAIVAGTGQPAAGFGKQNRSFQFVKEAGAWKIRREEASEAELTAMLVAANNEEERAALLDANKDLLTVQLCDTLVNQGRSFAERSNYSAALIAFQLSRTVADGIGNTTRVIAALSGTGNVCQLRGDLPAALEAFQQAQKLAEVSGENAPLAGLQSNLCIVQQRLGNYDLATEHCQRGLALAEAAGNRAVAANTLNNLGIIARLRGNYELALGSYRRSLALFEALDDKRSIARLENNLGVAYNAMGNATAALQHYLRSLPIAEEVGNKAGVASTLNNVSMIYRGLGNYSLALEYSQRSFAISEAIGDKTEISFALEEIGKIHAQAGEHARALECYRKSLEIAEQTGEKVEIAIRLLSVGNGYGNLGDDTQALAYYQRGLSLAESIGAPFTTIAFLFRLAHLQLKQGRAAEALEFAERSVAQSRQIGAHRDYWQALLIAGLAFRALNQPVPARQRFEEAIRVIETARSQLAASEPEQAFFFETRFDPYVQMVMLLAEQGKAAEAFNFAERAKARVLLDVLHAGRVDISKAMSEQEKEQENRLRMELNSLNTQLRRESGAATSEHLRVEELKAKLGKARLAYESFQTQLYVAHPELRIKRGQSQPLSLEQANELLSDSRTALIEYAVAGDKTFLFVITAERGLQKPFVKMYELNIKHQDLAERVQKLNQRIANNDLEYAGLSSELYDLLIAPAREQLKGKTRLVIVPDDILWEIPFQALRSADGRFLIQSAAISYAPSLTVLRELVRTRKSQSSSTLLAMGNPTLAGPTISRSKSILMGASFEPLPEAERMVKGLSQMYGAKARVYVGAEAREDLLKAEAGKYRILQLATHGVINNASPMYSHLVLAQGDDGKEDGLLEAWEIMQLDLKADLAVLSACDTARGRIGAGEGVIGLAWALFVAGCPTTVVSQWKVESSSTAELMLAFHHNLQAGSSKSEALRQAALKLITDRKHGHPFYWGGFIVVGNPN